MAAGYMIVALHILYELSSADRFHHAATLLANGPLYGILDHSLRGIADPGEYDFLVLVLNNARPMQGVFGCAVLYKVHLASIFA